MKFDQLARRILLEMPHLDVLGQTFDLGAEEFKNDPEKLLKKIQRILRGQKDKDKYGSVICLTTPEEIAVFKNEVLDSRVIQKILSSEQLELIQRS